MGRWAEDLLWVEGHPPRRGGDTRERDPVTTRERAPLSAVLSPKGWSVDGMTFGAGASVTLSAAGLIDYLLLCATAQIAVEPMHIVGALALTSVACAVSGGAVATVWAWTLRALHGRVGASLAVAITAVIGQLPILFFLGIVGAPSWHWAIMMAGSALLWMPILPWFAVRRSGSWAPSRLSTAGSGAAFGAVLIVAQELIRWLL